MRVRKNRFGQFAEGDMTPMIDMTFQLIAFFMVLINFTEAETDQRVELPSSILAIPPDQPLEQPLTIQLTRDGTAIVGGEDYAVGQALEGVLGRERRALGLVGKTPAETTIIIRAHRDAETGKVQEIIELCQKAGFEKFRLRAKEDSSVPNYPSLAGG